ncbi:MAG: NlpC/P60 family protein [Bacteroidota bacterium]
MKAIFVCSQVALFTLAPAVLANENESARRTYHPNKIDTVINEAKTYYGVTYKWGGNDYRGVDCSGLVHNAFDAAGIDIPRNSRLQARFHEGEFVAKCDLQRGDIIFFDGNKDGNIDHVGLVVSGKGDQARFIHSSSNNGGVAYNYLYESHWSKVYKKGTGKRMFWLSESGNSANKEDHIICNDDKCHIRQKAVGRFPYTSERALTIDDVEDLTLWEIKIMKNEIYARHGYIFHQNRRIISYFEGKDWYRNTPKITKEAGQVYSRYFNKYEKFNTRLLVLIEDRWH